MASVVSNSTSVVQQVTNGQLVQNTSSSEEKTQSQTNKDMFLQLLVAEMQYQDPLEPTDNSEYIQQLYSMSQTESILQVQEDMESLTARNMVGKYVTVQDPVTGEYIDGKVDSVADTGDGSLKVSLNGNVYSVSDVKQIHDEAYFSAVTASNNLTDMVERLPAVENLRVGQKEDLEKAVEAYNNMDDYTKGFLETDTINKLTDLVSQMNILLKKQEELDAEDDAAAAEKTEKTEATEDAAAITDKTETAAAETGSVSETPEEPEENAADEIVEEGGNAL